MTESQLDTPSCEIAATGYNGRMPIPPAASYTGHRFPPEIIARAVRLYFRVLLSYRDIEERLITPGIHVTYETIRPWGRKFGQSMGQTQCFLAAFEPRHGHFRLRRHKCPAAACRA